MRSLPNALFAVAAVACACIPPVFAQTAPVSPSTPSSESTSPAMAPPGGDETNEGTAKGGGVKAVRQGCRADADAKGLKGPAKREAISACVVEKRPDQAGREACRSQGFAKGLRKDELHAFVKDCAKSKG